MICHPLQRPVRALSVDLPLLGKEQSSFCVAGCLPASPSAEGEVVCCVFVAHLILDLFAGAAVKGTG